MDNVASRGKNIYCRLEFPAAVLHRSDTYGMINYYGRRVTRKRQWIAHDILHEVADGTRRGILLIHGTCMAVQGWPLSCVV